MREGGHHLILDLEGCDTARLDSPRAMARLLKELGRAMAARILDTRSLRFQPRGVTAFSVLAESHISVHTWPEAGKAFLDVFTCQNHFRADTVTARALTLLSAKRAGLTHLYRDGGGTRLLFHGAVETEGASFEFGRTIFSHRSRFQKIELTRGPLGISLFLDDYWQFVERWERAYHETLVHPAAVCAPRLDRVGIAGGGDGLALREVLRYPDLGRADLYELDPAVLGLANGHPDMLRLNRRSLRHLKARVVAADARKMLNPGAGYSLLIVDFPSANEGTGLHQLYTLPFYQKVRRALAADGYLVVQVTDYIETIVRVRDHLRKLFPHVVPMSVGASASMYSFVLAGAVPIRQRRPLPRGLEFITARDLEKFLAMVAGARTADGILSWPLPSGGSMTREVPINKEFERQAQRLRRGDVIEPMPNGAEARRTSSRFAIPGRPGVVSSRWHIPCSTQRHCNSKVRHE